MLRMSLTLFVGLFVVLNNAFAKGNEAPRSPLKPRVLNISPECEKIYRSFDGKQRMAAERMMGFWEPQQLNMSKAQQQRLLGAQRKLVGDETKKLNSFEERQLLRGIVPLLTGWGNCGEHTSWGLVDFYEGHIQQKFMGCEGAQVFSTSANHGDEDLDHVWVEVWVPKDTRYQMYTQYGDDEPRAIPGIREGKEGYYFVFDYTVDFASGYRVLRNMRYEFHGEITPFHEFSIDRVKFEPTKISSQRYNHIQAVAKGIASKLKTKEDLVGNSPKGAEIISLDGLDLSSRGDMD